MPYTRREMIKAFALTAGAAAFSPFLEQTLLASQNNAATMPRRYLFFIKASGVERADLVPDGVERAYSFDQINVGSHKLPKRESVYQASLKDKKLPDLLGSFESMKDQITILQGLSGENLMGNHTAGLGMLSAHRSERVAVAPTLDYLLGAKHSSGPYPMFGLSTVNGSALQGRAIADSYTYPNTSAAKAGVEIPFQSSPEKAYRELFGAAVLGRGEAERKLKMKTNLMDFLKDDAKKVKSALKGGERERFDHYVDSLESLREREEKKMAIADRVRKHVPTYDDRYQSEVETVRMETQCEMATAALISGLTNSVTVCPDGLGMRYTGMGINLTHLHDIGHGSSVDNGWSSRQACFEIEKFHLALLAKAAKQLASIPEGDGSMLDHTVIVYTSCAGGSHHSGAKDWPFVLIGGKGTSLKTGQYLQYPNYQREGHKTLSNLYMSLMQDAGVSYGERFGQMDSMLRDIDVSGPLTELV